MDLFWMCIGLIFMMITKWHKSVHLDEIVGIVCDEKYLAADGKPDVEKMHLITFDPIHHTYIELGQTIGKAFSDGKKLI